MRSAIIASSRAIERFTTYYVRPSGSTYGSGTGLSYADAWSGFSAINWSLVSNNVLSISGTHTQLLTVGASNCIIKSNISDPATINGQDTISTCVDVNGKTGVIIKDLTIIDATTQCLFIQGASQVVTNNLVTSGSGNQAVQHYGTAQAIHNNLTCNDCVDDGISAHDDTIITVNGGSFTNCGAGINIVHNAKVTINGNPTFSGNTEDIAAENATTLESCVITANDCTFTSNVLATNLAKVVLNNCVAPVVNLTGGGVLESDGSVIENITLTGASVARIDNSRLNDITTIPVGGVVELTNSYVKPVGVFDVNGTLRAERTLFDGIDETDHIIDCNSGSTLKLQYCIFRNVLTGKYCVSVRTGTTVEAMEALTMVGNANVGRGLLTQVNLTVKNLIVKDMQQALFSSAILTIENGCLHNNTTPTGGTGSVVQNDMVTGDPLFTNAAALDYSLQAGSPCIGTGEVLTNNIGILTADWGDADKPPAIETVELSTFNIGAI